jgi:drug/metabolite transporter (DMT)-like permease
MRAPRDPQTFAAFGAAVVIGGLNFVAVRFSNAEIPPFSGAAIRFAAASLIFFGAAALLRVPMPRGRALVGVLLYGVLGFAAGYALAYSALVEVPAGTASVIMALVPLLTIVLAAVHGLERLRPRAVGGALLAVLGVGVVFGERLSADVPLPSLLVMGLAAVTAAETSVVVKRFPRSQPLAANAIGMGVGALLLTAIAAVTAETLRQPQLSATWISLGYLVLVGSIGLFLLFLFVLGRWAASSTSYMFVLAPLVAIPVGAALASEPVSAAFIVGGALVLAGVYLGAQQPAMPGAERPAPLPECCPPGVVKEPPRART